MTSDKTFLVYLSSTKKDLDEERVPPDDNPDGNRSDRQSRLSRPKSGWNGWSRG